ncbi:phosphatidylethanolamine-binding protein 4 isoform X2 [Aptenodytes patagonicus]|uniref:phosphatidylethanolamine-binding protein 4 isoform X2 n=1 Tax=Aptenodytes patagonicus TaxID=9234 RepID=UPI003FA0FB83
MAKPGIAARSPHRSSPTRNRKKPQSLPLKRRGWQPARPRGELGVCCELPPPARPRSRDRHIWGEQAQLEGLGMHGWVEQMCASGWRRHAHRLGRGADLRTGDVKGHVLTDYVRPMPPPRSGYHRYQLRLYEQPAHEAIALSPEERVSLGAWAMESFVEQFRLGSPVASTQFLTKYYED